MTDTDTYQPEFPLHDEWQLVSDDVSSYYLGDDPRDVEYLKRVNEEYDRENPNQGRFQFYTEEQKMELWYRGNDTNKKRHSDKIQFWYSVVRQLSSYYRKGGKKDIKHSILWALERMGKTYSKRKYQKC